GEAPTLVISAGSEVEGTDLGWAPLFCGLVLPLGSELRYFSGEAQRCFISSAKELSEPWDRLRLPQAASSRWRPGANGNWRNWPVFWATASGTCPGWTRPCGPVLLSMKTRRPPPATSRWNSWGTRSWP